MPPAREPDPRLLLRQLRLLRVFAAFTFPFACVPFLYFYYQEHGVGLAEYGTLVSIYYVSMVVLEIPTGILADRYGKRLAMLLGPVVLAAGFWVIWGFESFGAFAIGQVTLGLGHSILSGPPSALLFQILRQGGRASEFRRRESVMHAFRLIGTGASFLAGGVVVFVCSDIAPSIVLTSALCLCASATALFVVEPRRGHPPPIDAAPVDDADVDASPVDVAAPPPLWRSALRDLRKPAVSWILVYYVVLFFLLRFPFLTYQPFLRDAHADDPLTVCALYFALSLFAVPFSRWAPALADRLGEATLFWAMPLGLAASLWLMAGQLNWLGISLFFVHQIPFGMHWALIQSFVNHRIEDASRATVLSVLSFAGRLAFALLFPLAVSLDTVGRAYLAVGITGLIATVPVVWFGRRYLGRTR